MAEDGGALLRLEQTVAYQDGAIVSRKLAASAGGNVSAFAFDAGEELSEHTTPHTALLQVLDGRAQVRVAGVDHTVGAGEAIVLPANQPHAVRAEVRFKMLLIMLKA
jgi:quercetin dioxygenase-like cupin family protein